MSATPASPARSRASQRGTRRGGLAPIVAASALVLDHAGREGVRDPDLVFAFDAS
jgi:hypothetical protein